MLVKLLCFVTFLAFVFGADAACGSTLSTSITRSDVNSTLEYLYVLSQYGVTVASGNELTVVWNGTDAGEVESLVIAGQSANITLVDGTISTPTRQRVLSAADRSTVGQTINILALILSLGAMQYFRKGFGLLVIIIALSMANLISSTAFSSAPCPDATVTLQIPEATIRFICINDEPCICGPGYSGNNCDGPSVPISAPTNPPVSPTCSDNTKNGNETDVDCGGSKCPKCTPGKTCLINTDCDSGVCTDHVCQQPTCFDTVLNGNETDVDCGGTNTNQCPLCIPGQKCLNGTYDCDSFVCQAGICQQPTCTDNVRNGNETDLDCGGKCPKCGLNQGCNSNSDCGTNLVCGSDFHCISVCNDGVQNNSETDIDCGGSFCAARCIKGQKCWTGSDCQSGQCLNLKCA